METILLDANGLRTDALLLAAGSNRLRIILRNGPDTIELRRESEQWVSEAGRIFEFEAWIASSCLGLENPSPMPQLPPPIRQAAFRTCAM